MSSRRGTQATPFSASGVAAGRLAPLADAEHRGEVLEEVGAVVGTGAGLGVVLHAEGGRVEHAQALAHAVVEVDVAHLGPAGEPVGVDGEVVVLAGDLHLAGGQVAHGVVAAVVAERELHGVGAERPAEELVAEADAEHRHVAEQPADGVDGVGHRGRVAGTVGEEHAGRLRGRARRRPWSTPAPPRRRTTTRGGAGSCA